MTKILLFDTYALVEIYKGNPNYKKYESGFKIILNNLNLLEFAYFLIKSGKENEISDYFDKMLKFNVDYDKEDLTKAAKMKFTFLKQRLSFIDCIGYTLAKKNNAKFLTGDEKFRHSDNVEFVK